MWQISKTVASVNWWVSLLDAIYFPSVWLAPHSSLLVCRSSEYQVHSLVGEVGNKTAASHDQQCNEIGEWVNSDAVKEHAMKVWCRNDQADNEHKYKISS